MGKTSRKIEWKVKFKLPFPIWNLEYDFVWQRKFSIPILMLTYLMSTLNPDRYKVHYFLSGVGRGKDGRSEEKSILIS